MLDAIVEPLKLWAEGLILQTGYWGIALLMFLDSCNIPIPSEVIMPFGGIMAAEGKLTFVGVGLAGSFGTVLGSILNYWIGAWLGKEGLIKYGRYILIRRSEVEHGDQWFHKHGAIVTLWGRFIPLVRTFISLPAGIYRMNFPLFTLYAILGATPWCFAWAWVGFKMGENWEELKKYWHYFDYLVVAVLLFFLVRWILGRRKPEEPEAA